MLSGAAGFTYGHNSVMRFYEGTGAGAFGVRYPWKDVLHGPAAASVVKMAEFVGRILKETAVEAVWQKVYPEEYLENVCGPCREMLRGISVWREEQREERVMAWRIGRYRLFYLYTGCSVYLCLDENCEAWWFDPDSGAESRIGRFDVECDSVEIRFKPPAGDFTRRDWLLFLKAD